MIANFVFQIAMGCVSTVLGLICLMRGQSGFQRTFTTAGLWLIAVAFWLGAMHSLFLQTHENAADATVLTLYTIFAWSGVSVLLTGLVTDWLQKRASRRGQDNDQP